MRHPWSSPRLCGGPRGILQPLAWALCRTVARRLPYPIKKAVLYEAWHHASHTRLAAGAEPVVRDAAELYLAFERRSPRGDF